MYHAIVERIARRNFERVAGKDYETLLSECASDVHHRFGGDHALGGERHDREALRLWFERLGRLFENLTFRVEDVWVKGLPHDTTAIARWSSAASLPDGTAYRNRGVHVVRMRWGKAVAIDAHEDSQAVAAWLDRLAARGVEEARAPQIVGGRPRR